MVNLIEYGHKYSSELWTEKYRPTSIDDIVGNEKIKQTIRSFIKYPNMFPQLMIFIGEAGTGKTSMANAIAHELYGIHKATLYKEYNASDDRGIDFIRRIKEIARSQTLSQFPFKIIFLDEADYLTPEAQASLRRVIEQYNAKTKFIFSVNFPNRIIKPLISRSIQFNFTSPSMDELKNFINKIAQSEKFTIDDDASEHIITTSNYIPRDILLKLQSAYVVARYQNTDHITLDIAYTVSPPLPDGIYLKSIIKAIKTRNLMDALNTTLSYINSGISPYIILKDLTDIIVKSPNITNKIEVIQAIAETEQALINGGYPDIHFAYLYSLIIQNYKPKNS